MKFSILIPAYKQQFLIEAINSCLSQTFSDFELIIVNDHSPENIDAVVNSYDDTRIHYYINELNFGAYNVVDNWNKCLNYSTGEYVICMGDDDRLLPHCLENYLYLISKYPFLDVYHTRTQIIDVNSNIINLQEARPEFESVYSLIWHRIHGRIQYIGDFLFKRDTLNKRGGFFKSPMGLASDDISVIMAASEHGIANTATFGFQYRNTPSTITNSNQIESTVRGVSCAKRWYSNFLMQNAESAEDVILRQLIIRDIDDYFSRMYLYLLRKDLAINGRKAYRMWLSMDSNINLRASTIKTEYIHFLKDKIIRNIKSNCPISTS